MDESSKLNLQVTNLRRFIEDVVSNFCKDDLKTLLDISHELIKYATLKNDEMMVDQLLNG